MKFSGREDIEAPIETVFDALCDFETFERQAMHRGAEVQRVDGGAGPVVGACWDTVFQLRGRRREMRLTLTHLDRPSDMRFAGHSSSMEVGFNIELVALSRSRTRMAVALTMAPQNLAARLLVQSLKLAKASLDKRFKARLGEYAKGFENRLRKNG